MTVAPLEARSTAQGVSLSQKMVLPDSKSSWNSSGAKVALQLLAASTVIVVVVAVPEQAPLQPLKDEPGEAAAVRSTSVPSS